MLNKRPTSRYERRGFTLLELTVSLLIIAAMIAVGSVTFRSIERNRSVAQARNAIVNYAAIARSYAIDNHIETMLVVNPYNGRFEIWHLNPPVDGGPWDPNSGGLAPPFADGYAFAPVLDDDASLPRDSYGKPTVLVNPIDYEQRLTAPTMTPREIYNNLIWAAFCFDADGTLVTRTRRIATRTAVLLNGANSGLTPALVNRLSSDNDTSIEQSQMPNMELLDPTVTATPMLVTGRDQLITSTRGFVISERQALEGQIGNAFNSTELVTLWLRETRPQRQYRKFANEVLLDRYSAEPLTLGDE